MKRIITAVSVLTLSLGLLTACKSGAVKEAGQQAKETAGAAACTQCDDVKTKCVEECGATEDKDACVVVCETAYTKCSSECKNADATKAEVAKTAEAVADGEQSATKAAAEATADAANDAAAKAE